MNNQNKVKPNIFKKQGKPPKKLGNSLPIGNDGVPVGSEYMTKKNDDRIRKHEGENDQE